MKRYVLGFMYNHVRQRVLLCRKARPQPQAGLLNGVGGKIESGESPRQAMRREFEEETGWETAESDWEHFATLRGPDFEVAVFGCGLATPSNAPEIRAQPDEPVDWYPYAPLPDDVLSNLRVLVPLGMDGSGIVFPVELADSRPQEPESREDRIAAGYRELEAAGPPVGSCWRHAKRGNVYRVRGVGLHSETLEPMVAYQLAGLDEPAKLWFRPAAMFMDGRFTRIED